MYDLIFYKFRKNRVKLNLNPIKFNFTKAVL